MTGGAGEIFQEWGVSGGLGAEPQTAAGGHAGGLAGSRGRRPRQVSRRRSPFASLSPFIGDFRIGHYLAYLLKYII